MGGLHLHPPIDHSGRQRRPHKRYKHLIFSILRWVAQYLQLIIMGCNREKVLRTAVLQAVACLKSMQWYSMKGITYFVWIFLLFCGSCCV